MEAVEATSGREHEGPHLADLLVEIEDVEAFVADAGYLSRRNCRLVAERGGVPCIKPKRNSTIRARGCWPWKRMVSLFRKHPRAFHRVYRLRERMEAWWRSLKSLVGDVVRSRTIQTIKAEIWSKIVCYNLVWTIRRSHGFWAKPPFRLCQVYVGSGKCKKSLDSYPLSGKPQRRYLRYSLPADTRFLVHLLQEPFWL
jgi:hypothetical protein